MSTAQSSFIGGMKKDFSPLISSNDTLTDALNATIITFNGNEYMLQQDMGNGRIETAYLPKGYVPVGIAEHGGIIYVASYNPLTQRSQIGSFPSPERNIASDENGETGQIFSTTDFVKSDTNEVITLSLTKVFLMNDIIRPGDKFYFYLDKSSKGDLNYLQGYNNQDYRPLKITPGIISSDGEFLSILDSIVEDAGQVYWADPDDNTETVNESIYLETYNSKIAGNLALSGELECINSISVTVNTGKITTSTDQEEYQFQINMSVDYSTLASIVNFRGYKIQLSTDADPKYIILNSWTNDTTSKKANYTSEFSGEMYTWENIDTPTSSDDIYNPGVATYLYQSATSKFESSPNLTITVTPLMTYGELTEYKQELVIDTSKIGSGEFNITAYKFMHNIADGLTQLYFNIENYPLVNETINSVTLNFYSYSKWNELVGSPYAGNYSTIKNNVNKSDLLVYSTQIPKQNSYNGIRTINIQSDFLPSKDEYIIEMVVSKSTTTYTDNGSGTPEESQQYYYFGLLTTEMFNDEYYDDAHDNDNFSTYTQDAISANLSLINSEPNRTMIRSNMPGSLQIKDSTTSPISEQSSATMTITDTYILNPNITISNKQNYPFDSVSIGKSTIQVYKSVYPYGMVEYPTTNIFTVKIEQEEAAKVSLSYRLSSDVDIKYYSPISANSFVNYRDTDSWGKLVLVYFDGNGHNRGYVFFFDTNTYTFSDDGQDKDNGDQANRATRSDTNESLGYRATYKNPGPNGLTGNLHILCSNIFKSMQNLIGNSFVYPFLSTTSTKVTNAGDRPQTCKLSIASSSDRLYFIMRYNNNDQICFLLPINPDNSDTNKLQFSSLTPFTENGSTGGKIRKSILVYNGEQQGEQTLNPYILETYTANAYTIDYSIITHLTKLDSNKDNLVYTNGNTRYYPSIGVYQNSYIDDWINKVVGEDNTSDLTVLKISPYPFSTSTRNATSVSITIDDFIDYERLLSNTSSTQYMFWNGTEYTSSIANGSITSLNDNTMLINLDGKVYIQQGAKPNGMDTEAWNFFNSLQYDSSTKQLMYNGSVTKADISASGPYFYLKGQGSTSETLYLKEFGGYVEDGGFFYTLNNQ